MPIYDFSCDVDKEGCGKETSIMCSWKDLPKQEEIACEHCGKKGVRRLYGIGMTRVTYDRNGRKAVRVRNQLGGNAIERSMTRQNHLDGKGTKSVYTKEYQNRLDKAAAEGAAKQRHMMKNRKG